MWNSASCSTTLIKLIWRYRSYDSRISSHECIERSLRQCATSSGMRPSRFTCHLLPGVLLHQDSLRQTRSVDRNSSKTAFVIHWRIHLPVLDPRTKTNAALPGNTPRQQVQLVSSGSPTIASCLVFLSACDVRKDRRKLLGCHILAARVPQYRLDGNSPYGTILCCRCKIKRINKFLALRD